MCAKVYGNKWETVESLTEGGQAHTFLVKDRESDGSVTFVLKRLKNPKRIDRFRLETDALRQIDHPNVLHLIDVNLDDAKPYFVTEYCSGGSLEKANSTNPFWHSDFEKKLILAIEISQGLSATHRKGIVHRDLKPANIFLRSESGPAVIGDFGLCFSENGIRCSMTGEVVGAANYIHPELEDGTLDDIKPYHDLYSLGKVIYWIFSNGKMFSREKHRLDDHNLSKNSDIVLHMQDATFYELVNRLLDKLITGNINEQYQGIDKVIVELAQIARIVEGEFHALASDVPQICDFCGIGNYFASGNFSTVLGAHSIGSNTQMSDSHKMFVCDYCGHVRLFYFGLGNQKSNWFNVSK
jgi:serine/threonine protein kinase